MCKGTVGKVAQKQPCARILRRKGGTAKTNRERGDREGENTAKATMGEETGGGVAAGEAV